MPRFTPRVPDPRAPELKHPQKPKVVVIGAGVAGLTVAYELLRTGRFDIEVIEKRPTPGGKARTLWDAKGFHEHSMRALLGSYVCLHQILGEVKTKDGPLLQRLRPAIMTLRYGPNRHEFTPAYTAWYWRFQYLRDQWNLLRFFLRSGLRARDLFVVVLKVFRLLTMKSWQVTSEISRLSFEDYVSDERRSDGIEKVVYPLAEIFVAAKAYASAGVVGRSLLEWFVNPFIVGAYTRRGFSEFDGPTSEAFIDPWVAWLQERGVRFRFDTTTTKLDIQAAQVAGITVRHGNKPEEVLVGDAYVLAVQHNIADALLPDDVTRFIPDLADFTRLGEEWAHSIQFVVDAADPEVLAIGQGFVGVIDSPWSIAYRIYSAKTMRPGVWAKGPLPPEKAIFTATMSNCRRPGIVHGLPFLRCTMEQIIDEVIAQTGLKSCLRPEHASLGLDLELVKGGDFDRKDEKYQGYAAAAVGQHDLVFRCDTQMYIRLPGNLDIEPENATGLYNFFLAGEYTKTRYMIPTMEKSCESGKRCSHAVLAAFGLPRDKTRVPNFELPLAFVRTEFFRILFRISRFLFMALALAALVWILIRR
ncbi:MAG: FAD-dependent oxidoreductase [Planctomycetes bacterium]|nr:FAD-dependent oxidoreductase [Planctomycetota bacterium]